MVIKFIITCYLSVIYTPSDSMFTKYKTLVNMCNILCKGTADGHNCYLFQMVMSMKEREREYCLCQFDLVFLSGASLYPTLTQTSQTMTGYIYGRFNKQCVVSSHNHPRMIVHTCGYIPYYMQQCRYLCIIQGILTPPCTYIQYVYLLLYSMRIRQCLEYDQYFMSWLTEATLDLLPVQYQESPKYRHS